MCLFKSQNKVADLVLEKLNEKIEGLEMQYSSLADKYEALKKSFSAAKAACLQTVMLAGDDYRRACNSGVMQHDRSVLALQYRDYLFIYSRLYKTDMALNEYVMADVKLLTDKHVQIGG